LLGLVADACEHPGRHRSFSLTPPPTRLIRSPCCARAALVVT
jgi:hypothetical protein